MSISVLDLAAVNLYHRRANHARSPRSNLGPDGWQRRSSIAAFAMPGRTALVIPPALSTSSISFQAALLDRRSSLFSDVVLPAKGSMTFGDVSVLLEKINCVLRGAMRDETIRGQSQIASSSAFLVCSDCVPQHCAHGFIRRAEPRVIRDLVPEG